MATRTKFSPCMIRSIINNITDHRWLVGQILEDEQVDTVLSLLGDCLNKRDRTVAKWKIVKHGNMPMLACSKCMSIIGYKPTPYCPSCGANMTRSEVDGK